MRILIAVDTVATTELLMNAFAARPWPRGTVARVVSVVEDEAVPQEVWRAAAFKAEAVGVEMKRRGEQISALTVAPLRWLGVEADVKVLRGDPQWLVPFEARKWGADLILIRAHNRTDFRNWMLGSVARAVTRDAPCSVEVIRAPSGRRRKSDGGMRILLATDGSGHSEEAVRAVAERPWPAHTEVKVMSMVNPVAYSFEELGLYKGGKTERAHRTISEAARVLTGAGLRVTAEVAAGRPARRIVGAAREMDADLIVVGTEDRGGLNRLLRGSVSEEVARAAHCSVSVVRRGSGAVSAPGQLALVS
ncbi:MAG TPA: universal stress protein [Pyrinomonadaceae bacterium]|nr:universal stress protein [Pyrinomonadaceae bacterium]